MPDLSDPTALPDEVREAAEKAVRTARIEHPYDPHQQAVLAVDAVAPILAAHFAAELDGWHDAALTYTADVARLERELDGLRAQIEEALRLRNKPGAHKEHVLAAFDEYPRGTVAQEPDTK